MNIMTLLIAILLSAGAAGYIVYRILRPKLIATQQLDTYTRERNKEILAENDSIKNENKSLLEKNKIIHIENTKLLSEKDSVQEQIRILNNSLSDMEKQAQEAADLFYNSKMEIAQEHLATSLEKEAQKFQDNITSFQEQYNETIAERM